MAKIVDCITHVSERLINILRQLREGCNMNDIRTSLVGTTFLEVPNFIIIPANVDHLHAFEKDICAGSFLDSSALSRRYLSVVSQCFQDRWKSAFRIILNVSLCIDQLKEISAVDVRESCSIIGKLLRGIRSIVCELRQSSRDIILQENSAIFLCLHQIRGILIVLVKGMENSSIYIIKYAAKCLKECLECIGKEVCERSELPCSEFLELMDCILSALERIPTSAQLAEIQEQADELLCHAMATAQVAVDEEDRTAIKAKSQAVLRCLETLKDALAGEDSRETSLSASSLNNALCEVERSVNIAVLRLVLDVCSGVHDPLKTLFDKCKPDSSEGVSKKQSSDLDDLIIDFDIFMDRLMQVGTFAVSCSSNARKAMKLRSCLATFESLEAEVVPCVTALYLDPSKENKVSSSLLLDRWMNEMTLYHNLLSSIVDPAAYTQVVWSYVKSQWNEFKQNNEESTEKIMRRMCKAASSLDPVIVTTIEQDSLQDSNEIKFQKCQLNIVISDCQRQLRKLPGRKEMSMDRLSNRAGDLVLEVELLWEALARQLVENEAPSTVGVKVEASHAKDYYKLCIVDDDQKKEVDSTLMTPFAVRGLQLVKEATLYNTPKRSTVRRTVKKTPLSRSIVRKTAIPSSVRSRCFRTPGNQTLQEAQSMELTDLLEELTKLDDTFGNQTVLQTQKDPLCAKELLQLFDMWEMIDTSMQSTQELVSSVGCSSLESQDVGTFERIRDLELVESKIENLKTTDDQFVTLINIP